MGWFAEKLKSLILGKPQLIDSDLDSIAYSIKESSDISPYDSDSYVGDFGIKGDGYGREYWPDGNMKRDSVGKEFWPDGKIKSSGDKEFW